MTVIAMKMPTIMTTYEALTLDRVSYVCKMDELRHEDLENENLVVISRSTLKGLLADSDELHNLKKK